MRSFVGSKAMIGTFAALFAAFAVCRETAYAGQLAEARAKLHHVIIIMQENRSFDHYFGTFRGADGFPRDANGKISVCVPLDPKNPSQGCVTPLHDRRLAIASSATLLISPAKASALWTGAAFRVSIALDIASLPGAQNAPVRLCPRAVRLFFIEAQSRPSPRLRQAVSSANSSGEAIGRVAISPKRWRGAFGRREGVACARLSRHSLRRRSAFRQGCARERGSNGQA